MNKISNLFYVLICAFLIISIALTIGYLLNARQTYKKNIHILTENRNTGVFYLAYDYFLLDGICPSSMGELYYYIKDRPIDIMLSQYFVDPFSSDLSQINLVPVFNKRSSKWEAILILSTGIDGKMNYEYTMEDTIFTDEINSLDLFYNSVYDLSLSLSFNPINFFFGDKDLLVSYYNCKDSFKKNGISKGVFDLDSLMNKLAAKKASNKRLPLGRIYLVKFNPSHSSWKNDVMICKLSNGYIASFNFYDSIEVDQFKQTGEQKLIGKIKEIDFENKRVSFIMCMSQDFFLP